MREIKFRGKVKYNGNHKFSENWIKGYYRNNENGNAFITETLDEMDNYIFDETEIDESTLGQYTGLKDKNGVEIYEGDILEINEKGRKLLGTETKLYDKYQVVLEKDGCYMNMSNIQYKESIKNKEFLGRITYLWLTEEYATVVGNIYDNPELLENT